jgi:uncharacterized protein with PIN domain
MHRKERIELRQSMINAGLFLESEQVEDLLEDLERLQSLLASKKRVCPHCKAELKPTRFDGYYDGFDYWACDCHKLPGAEKNIVKGGYA